MLKLQALSSILCTSQFLFTSQIWMTQIKIWERTGVIIRNKSKLEAISFDWHDIYYLLFKQISRDSIILFFYLFLYLVQQLYLSHNCLITVPCCLLQTHVLAQYSLSLKMTEERESWNNHCEFFLTSLGLAVGLGNVWRFPYVCFENGGLQMICWYWTSETILSSGASFMIPYIVMLLVVGLPAMLIELSAGQYARVGANKVFGRMVPAFKVSNMEERILI